MKSAKVTLARRGGPLATVVHLLVDVLEIAVLLDVLGVQELVGGGG